MTTHPPRTDGTLRELSETECWRLLESHDLGRIAYVGPGGPVILPLAYVAEAGRIWFATASYDQLAVHLPGALAAFEIDESDPTDRTGWSVLVRGRAEHVTVGHPLAAGLTVRPRPWPDGTRTMLFCLVVARVSGRAVDAAVATVPDR